MVLMSIAHARCLPGDARVAADYARLLGGERADILLSDPPYCLLTRRRAGGDLRDPKGRKLDRDPVLRFEDVRTYRRFTDAWLTAAVAHVNPDAPLVLWTNVLGAEPMRATARALGYVHDWGDFIWAKRTKETRGASEELLRVYEFALILSRHPKPALGLADKPITSSVIAGYDDEGEGTDWGSHPHHKPFGVIEPLIRLYTAPGALILDPFAGSGSIGVAAVRLGRRAASLELKPDWAAKVAERFASETSVQ
jgi:site-specific DNA-methyltransferase (adenine-specific)